MRGFIINLNSEMKVESCVAKLDLDWFAVSFAVSFGGICLGVLGWRDWDKLWKRWGASYIGWVMVCF